MKYVITIVLMFIVFVGACSLTYRHDGSRIGFDYSGRCVEAPTCSECAVSTSCHWCPGFGCREFSDLTCSTRISDERECR